MDDRRNVTDMESMVGVLTSSRRNTWAEARDTHFSSGVNKASLNAIESAAFVLVLEQESYTANSEVVLNHNPPNRLHYFKAKIVDFHNSKFFPARVRKWPQKLDTFFDTDYDGLVNSLQQKILTF